MYVTPTNTNFYVMDYSDDDFYEDSIYDDFDEEQIELDPLDESDDHTVFD